MSHKWHGKSQPYHAPWQQWQLRERKIRHERGEAHLTEAMRRSGWIQRCAIWSRKRWVHRYQTSAFKVNFRLGWYLVGGYSYQTCFYIDFNWVGSRGNTTPSWCQGRKVTLVRKSMCVLFCSRLGKCALMGGKVHFQSGMDFFQLNFEQLIWYRLDISFLP